MGAEVPDKGLSSSACTRPSSHSNDNVDNVRRAVQQMRIDYPVVIDNDYAIWRAFRNQYWPALYFLDARGRIRHHHFGEGEYEHSERAIQRLLSEAGVAGVSDGIVSVDGSGVEAAADWANLRSPETYVGYERSQNFASRTLPGWISAARIVPPRDWRSINGRSPATGRWAGRRPS